ncbi:MAG: polysaccharide biosynthesis C-terminal domain-containing protein, partial [Clostridiales bacterium]|nr:polysaccharide biosynthesis C-terminal domain-containing protein [Clostridiales bacterium]
MKNNGQALIRDLTAGSIPRRLLAFAGPLFLSGLLQTTYNMADMAVVGHFGGSAGLSAVTNGGEILSFLTFVAIGFSNAGQVILSQLVGANRKESVGRLVGTLFTSMLGAALALTAACVALSDAMLGLINTPPEAWDGTADYVVICCLGLVFIYGYNLAGAILRGLGDSRHPFVFVAIASLVNVALDLLFVAVFGWGVAGAALATVIGQAVSFACALVFLYRRRAWLGFDFKPSSFRLDRELFPALVRLGVP